MRHAAVSEQRENVVMDRNQENIDISNDIDRMEVECQHSSLRLFHDTFITRLVDQSYPEIYDRFVEDAVAAGEDLE